MIGSISSFQPQIQGFQSPRQAIAKEEVISDSTLKEGNSGTLESESSKLARKALSELSQKEQEQVQKLKNRDLEVKAHEQAHLSAAGSLAIGGASFTYTKGSNGVRYATGGEVNIDTSAVANDPIATIKKAATIRRAALAPANPSQQDQLVANQASALEQEARIELSQEAQKEKEDEADTETEQSKEENSGSDSNLVASTNLSPGSLINLTV